MGSVLNNEEVLISINAYKDIKSSGKVIGNFITNLFTAGVAGSIANNFKLTLTPENLYIDTIEIVAWGGLPETLYTDKISREDIQSFEVKTEGTRELITITTNNDKAMTFIRDNEKNNDFALIMATLISENKKIKYKNN